MNKDGLILLAIQVLDGLCDSAVLVDKNLRVITANSHFWQLMEWSKLDEQHRIDAGVNLFDWLHQGNHSEKILLNSCMKNGQCINNIEVALRGEEGENILCKLNAIPFGPKPAPELLILIYRSYGEELHLQREYRVLLHGEMERGHELERQVAERTRQLKDALDEVVQLSRVDPLTGLLNRRAFQESALPMLGLIARHKRRGALILSDLDYFKKLNDTFGHPAGDAMLVAVSHALKSSVRQEDVVCRFGGEEFLIFLTEVRAGGIEVTVQRCLESIRNIKVDPFIPDKNYRQTISMGVALVPEHGSQLDHLIAIADSALYQAKRKGRDCYVMAKPELSQT